MINKIKVHSKNNVNNKTKSQNSYWEKLINDVSHEEENKIFADNQDKGEGKRFTSSIEIKVDIANEKSRYIDVTKREAECMVHLFRGLNPKDIANELGLSSRTVEFYFNNLRRRVGCKTKAELIDLVSNSDFMDKVNS